jgi:hypothetical protein
MEPQKDNQEWPALSFNEWQETMATLHMWMQIVGKIRLSCAPWTNHSWHVTLYLTARGLTTSPMPYDSRTFEIVFDFLDHELRINTSGGVRRSLKLQQRSVADFYRDLTSTLQGIEIPIQINVLPNEIQNPIPFDRDEEHHSYDAEYANRFWRVLVQADRVFKEFRSRFCGKCSPVHFFWGSFDLAVTRFSGCPAPPHPGGIPHLPDAITREAYSHEVVSHGFWPGSIGGPIEEPAFYAYAAPEPAGFKTALVGPPTAAYIQALGEFILPYASVRAASSPERELTSFLESTYERAADLADWPRADLERGKPVP